MAVRRRPKPLLFFLIFMGLLLISTAFLYMFLISPVDKNDSKKVDVLVPSGTGVSGIAKILKEKDLIRSELLFKVLVKTKKDLYLKAANYQFSKDMSMDEIVEKLIAGSTYNPYAIIITFKEGQRITDFAELISKNTNNTKEEVLNVINNKEYLEQLIKKYWFLTDSILTPGIYYPLEGYLAPDTYQFENKDVTITAIIETMLDEMDKKLSPYKNTISNNIHYYMTMASIVELEGTNTDNRKMITGVFQNRLKANMNLGSDVTTYYALQYPMTSDLTASQFATLNPYNTRASNMGGKMPIGPICNPSLSSIKASLEPTPSTYLYFVADKNGNIFYTNTLSEHEKKVQEIKDKGDWIW